MMGDGIRATVPVKTVFGEGGRRRSIALAVQLLLLALLVWKTDILSFQPPFQSLSHQSDGEWRWSNIVPTKDLTWHHCYENYDCARLDVPLDWLEPSEHLRASIAIIRLNATDRSDYRGPVFINPGGPGGSGIWFVKRLGPYYQMVVGRNHDIISFDPRGVGLTTPYISCWNNPQLSRIWGLNKVDVVDAYPGVLSDVYARSNAFSQQCASVIGGRNATSPRDDTLEWGGIVEAGAGRFVSTASAARDMLEIMEKSGEDKLQYWGFSYGTVLGIVFATMFPDRVGRMVNDGNVDVEEYTSGSGTHYVQDTDKVMDAFYQFCYLAGPDKCAFYDKSPQEIEARLDRLFAAIKKAPVVVPASSPGEMPEVISYSNVRRLQTSILYQPLLAFPSFAQALAGLEFGDGTHFIELIGRPVQDLLTCDTSDLPILEDPELEVTADASPAILCSDAGLTHDTVDDLQEYVSLLANMSKAAGATMADLRTQCIGWSVEAKWRITGPFTSNTSSPVLFVANKADNVTPLRSALQNAKGFLNSVVLVQNSYGHTSLAAPSRCTAKAIQTYFQDGVLPDQGTVCEADLAPFDSFDIPSLKDMVDANSLDNSLDIALLNLMRAPIIPAFI